MSQIKKQLLLISFWWKKLSKTPKFEEPSVCVYRVRERRPHCLIKAVVPKVCSADKKEAATSYQGIRGYFQVTTKLKFTYFLIKGIKQSKQFFNCDMFMTVNLLVPTKPSTIMSTKFKSCNALLRMLSVYIMIYLKSVMRQRFLVFDTYLPDNLHLREQGSQIGGYFSKPKGARGLKISETLH